MLVSVPTDVTTSVGDADCYITRVGNLLRRISIDELPQLFNVLTGKMFLVGYRPLVKSEVNCNKMRNDLGVFRMKPGITGFVQINGRDNVYYKNKVLLDVNYVRNASFLMDLWIILKTIPVVLYELGNRNSGGIFNFE